MVCGEAHRLPFLWKNRNDSLYGRKESHVQHAVRFIEDENTQRVKMEEPAIEVVLEPSRSRNHQPCSLAEWPGAVPLQTIHNDERGG